jgi:hypothetical protein
MTDREKYEANKDYYNSVHHLINPETDTGYCEERSMHALAYSLTSYARRDCPPDASFCSICLEGSKKLLPLYQLKDSNI